MEYWDLIEEPIGEVYQSLIKVLCAHSDKFGFVTRKELKYEKDAIARFHPYILDTYRTKTWANTVTSGPPATIYMLEANEETRKLLARSANSLYDWVAPNLPEDLMFYKNNFSWFTCTTHERFGGFSIRSIYYQELIMNVDGLKIRRTESS